jgi:glycolate oxidase FAD binding subunit
MPQQVEPGTATELAEALHSYCGKRQAIRITGNNTKRLLGGPVVETDAVLSTTGLNQVLDYEPNDLTISVGAGLRFAEMQSLLAEHGQMVALDPPFAAEATVGGVIASNGSGPLRCAYGTARDLVIGMEFATPEGKLVRTGGMVVKNVAGLDMAKIMIGSLGTLAVITSVNFRLHSLPAATNTFLYEFSSLSEALEKRNQILGSVLQPIALDLFSPAAARHFDKRGFVLAIRAAGAERVLRRYGQELKQAELLRGPEEPVFWQKAQEFAADFLGREAQGVIVKVSGTLQSLADLPPADEQHFIFRAANGVAYHYFQNWSEAAPWWQQVIGRGIPAVVEYAPDAVRRTENLWSAPSSEAERHAFDMMEKVKRMFDPEGLLNPKRLYGRI